MSQDNIDTQGAPLHEGTGDTPQADTAPGHAPGSMGLPLGVTTVSGFVVAGLRDISAAGRAGFGAAQGYVHALPREDGQRFQLVALIGAMALTSVVLMASGLGQPSKPAAVVDKAYQRCSGSLATDNGRGTSYSSSGGMDYETCMAGIYVDVDLYGRRLISSSTDFNANGLTSTRTFEEDGVTTTVTVARTPIKH